MMRNFTRNFAIIIVLFLSSLVQADVKAQEVPDLMYYKFDAPGPQVNSASAPVGTNPAPFVGTGHTIGTPAQFVTALSSTGAASTEYLNTGWPMNLSTIPWTMSFWLNNVPSGSSVIYLLGDPGTSMRCFVNGAPLAGNMRLTGTGLPNIDINGVSGISVVFHFVRTVSPNEIKVYRNGVYESTWAITGTISAAGTGFRLGNYNSGGLNGQMDEFRLYSRALDATEIASTWNQTLPLNASPCTTPPNAGTAVTSPSTAICGGTPVGLNLTGYTTGVGQTYQWQSASTLGGTYTNIGSSSSIASYSVSPATTTYYRCAVTCGASTTYSTPVQIFVNPAFPGGTYTINSILATGGSNFQTFSDAVSAISCGIAGPITFNVEPGSGPYNEQVTIPQIPGASAINTVKFNGNGTTLNISAVATTNSRHGFWLNGADHIIIDSLNIDGSAGTFAWGVVLTNQADSNIVRKCNINIGNLAATSTNFIGVVLNGSATATATAGNNANFNLFEKNSINGGYYGFYVYGSSTINNINNTFRDNIVSDMYAYGVYLVYQSNAIVSRNDFSRRNRTSTTTVSGVYASTGTLGVLIEKNRIHNLFDALPASTSAAYPVYVGASGTAAQVNRVENNLIYNINSNATGTIYGIYGSATSYSYWNVYHNTILLDHQGSTAGTTYGIYLFGAAGVNIKNNIVMINRSGTGIKYCLYYSTVGVASSNNNILINTSTGGTTNNIGYYSTGYITLSAWQAVFDQQSIDSDPVFLNAGAGDLKPSSSIIDNLGTPVGIVTDIEGITRSTIFPDLGGYEFGTIPLPITLSFFSGEKQNATNVLSWTTAAEQNNAGFELERGADGISFGSLGFIASKAVNGNSSLQLFYSFNDIKPYPGNNYYRLKQVDKDGRSTYSTVVLLKGNKQSGLAITKLYPNPVKDKLTVMLTVTASDKVSLVITDLRGKTVMQQHILVSAGDNRYDFNVARLASGTYFIKAVCNDGCETAVQQFSK